MINIEKWKVKTNVVPIFNMDKECIGWSKNYTYDRHIPLKTEFYYKENGWQIVEKIKSGTN